MQDVDKDGVILEYDENDEQQYIEEILPLLKEKNNRSFSMNRLEHRWREKVTIDYWKEHAELWAKDYPSYVHYLEGREPDFRALSDGEQTAAARGFLSALQWLTTNVGHCYLTEMLALMGEKIVEEDWVRNIKYFESDVSTTKQKIVKQRDYYLRMRVEEMKDLEYKLTSNDQYVREDAVKRFEADKILLARFDKTIADLTAMLEKPKVVTKSIDTQ